MVFYNALLLFFAAMSLGITCHAAICSVGLPQDETKGSPCDDVRRRSLDFKHIAYGIKRATPQMPYNRLNMTPGKYLLFLATNPFLAKHSVLWINNGALFRNKETAYLLGNYIKPQDMTTKEYAELRRFYRNHESSPLNLIKGYLRYPSTSQPFQSDFTKWISDHFFAEQRLSGVNPMTIQKVTFSNTIGMHYDRLNQLLNPDFDLVKAVNKVLGQDNNQSSITQAIKEGHVSIFVLYEPLNSHLESSRDLTNGYPKRHMWSFKAPIALFVSRPENGALTPIAIQMDDGKESAVYTPQDGDNWMLAKLNVQLSDYSTSQIVEHLCKVHFTIETVCLAVERQLSERHPLYDFMRFHCRGIFTANTLGGPILLDDGKDLDYTVEYGNEGANYLTKAAAKLINWDDLDLKKNIQRRGVDDKKRLPYYPYRDDGLVICDVLGDMVREYVNEFYPDESSVPGDWELQRFAREISKEGYGSLRGFPSNFTDKDSLTKTFTRILWIMTGHHTAINYPQADYATYIPNIPTKMYDVEGVAKNEPSTKRLDNRIAAAKQLHLVNVLSSFRMDRLFDYGDRLGTQKGRTVVNKYKNKVGTDIEALLVKRNEERLEQGHLTYPYFQPSWLTNGIQA